MDVPYNGITLIQPARRLKNSYYCSYKTISPSSVRECVFQVQQKAGPFLLKNTDRYTTAFCTLGHQCCNGSPPSTDVLQAKHLRRTLSSQFH